MLFGLFFVSGLIIGLCIGLYGTRLHRIAINKELMERYKKSMLGDP